MGDEMKINIKRMAKIIFVMVLMLVIFIPISNVLGVTSADTADTATSDAFKSVLGWMMKIGTGPLTAAIATLLNIVLIIVFMLLYFIFSPISAGLAFPFPDQIIFNKIGFFDPNFINPTTVAGSPVLILQGLIKNLYYTGFVIAAAVFVVAAMIIGIKLAVSTIASEKSHYKQALVTWVTGVFLLFTTHFILLAIFTVNEEFVKILSSASENIVFKFQWTEQIPLIGNSVTNILNAITGLLGGTEPLGVREVTGYGGLLIKFASAAIGGDLVASIICGILLGQTVAIIMMYLKRLFYSIILGIIAPLIIAADIMKKSL